jgi:DNA-binding transcriptional regulator YiaG
METNVKALRTRLGLSRERLARILNVSAVSVANWEAGRNRPSPMAQEKLARASRRLEGAQHA